MKARELATQLFDEVALRSFKASNGWIYSLLKRNNSIGVKLHGEAGEISNEEAQELLLQFRSNLALELEKHNIKDLGQVYNGDQTGLFYQKLPNHAYIHREERQTKRESP